MQSLCTLRPPLTPVATQHSLTKRALPPYLGRTPTGWIAPACGWRTYVDHLGQARASSLSGTSRPSALAVFEVKHELEFGGLHDRKVGGFLALQDATGVDAGLSYSRSNR